MYRSYLTLLVVGIALFGLLFLWQTYTVRTETIHDAVVPDIVVYEDTIQNYTSPAYSIEITLPDVRAPFVAHLYERVEAMRDVFMHEAEVAFRAHDSSLYDWQPHVLGMGYETYVRGDYTWYVLSAYQYIGGANGMQMTETFGYDASGRMLDIHDVVPNEQHIRLLALVQQKLYTLNGVSREGGDVFAEAIAALTISDLTRFYMTDTELTLLFDEYDVAPGVFGVVRIPILLDELEREDS